MIKGIIMCSSTSSYNLEKQIQLLAKKRVSAKKKKIINYILIQGLALPR